MSNVAVVVALIAAGIAQAKYHKTKRERIVVIAAATSVTYAAQPVVTRVATEYQQ